jgi:nucleotide-binding universal stress UspA family protein
MFRKILLANSGNLDADGAFEASLALARRFDAELHMAIVEELSRFPISIGEVDDEREGIRQRTTYIISSATGRAAAASVTLQPHVVLGRMLSGVLSIAAEIRCDLLIVGTKSRPRFSDMFYGHFSERLTRAVTCPVLLIK